MYKNVKSKIILISVIIGLILIGSLSFLYLTSISEIQVFCGQEHDITTFVKKIDYMYKQAEISIITIIILYIVIAIIISSFLSKFVIYPKNKFIKGDEFVF